MYISSFGASILGEFLPTCETFFCAGIEVHRRPLLGHALLHGRCLLLAVVSSYASFFDCRTLFWFTIDFHPNGIQKLFSIYDFVFSLGLNELTVLFSVSLD